MAIYQSDLGIENYILLQDTEDYAFTQDSVFLANLAKIYPSDSVIDLGCGNGIVSTLIAVKKHCSNVVGLDINKSACELAEKSCTINHLQDKLKFICGDVRDIASVVGFEKFDKAVCNPPYFEQITTASCDNQNLEYSTVNRKNARSESTATLDDFIVTAFKVLKFGGELTIVLKHDRLCDLLFSLRKNLLEPKHIIYVYPKVGREIDTVIVRARKGGGHGLTAESIFVKDA
ncbi:MAG: methyltransferase, partial [Clostridia bacterium]